MHTNRFRRTRVATAVAGMALALGAGQALGTGFQLNENSGSSIGNAFAAGAAFTDDASAMWWNPAALSQFTTIQGVGALNIITPSIKFKNNASLPAANQPLGGNGGDAGGNNYVPNLYVSVPINAQWTFGLGINAPFGLTTEYDDGWLGRYQGLKSEIKTINVNPAVSWKVTPQFAVGVGVNYNSLDATLTQSINYSGALLTAAAGAGIAPGSPTFNAIAQATPGLDSKLTLTGNDGAWGWNVGFAWDATPQLRLAAAYRSELKFSTSGNMDFNNPTPAPPPGTPAAVVGTIALLSAGVNSQRTYNRGISADITLPQIANVSMLYRVNSQWEVMADAQYTGWSSIPELRFATSDGSAGPVLNLNWDDSWKISGGASYRVNDQWKARFGVAFDQSPVTNDPTVRLPDSDRWWLATGVEYKWTPNWKFDAGFVYIIADSPSFNQNKGSTASFGLVNGSYDASVWILSMQATYAFSPPPQPIPKVAEVAPPPPAPIAKPAPPPPPPPAPPPPAPQVQKITLDSKVLFDFDKAVLRPEGKAAIDSQVVGNLAQVQKLDVVLVTGHTDRLGTEKYNQGLSERRADAVRDYLVSKGIDKAKIETIGLGEKQPVVQCDQKSLKELIACLQPNRRVEVQVKGETVKK